MYVFAVRAASIVCLWGLMIGFVGTPRAHADAEVCQLERQVYCQFRTSQNIQDDRPYGVVYRVLIISRIIKRYSRG